MTDNEIVKALECCFRWELTKDCSECAYENSFGICKENLLLGAIDVINRQKAEIETLREKYDRARCNLTAVLDERADHSEAIEEFAETLKQMMFAEDFLLCEPCDMADLIDNLVKEMVGEEK